MRVYDNLLTAARETPERIALEFKGLGVPYGALGEETLRLAAAVRAAGLGPGDSLGVMLPNVPQFVAALYAGFLNGCRVVPMNVLLRPPEIQYLVEDSDIRMIFTWEGFLPAVNEGIVRTERPPKVVVLGANPGAHVSYHQFIAGGSAEGFEPHESGIDTPILTVYTSGTTGKPKGAIITNGNLVSQLEMMDEVFEPLEGDKFLCVLPLFHVFALNAVLNASIKNRTTVVLHPKFEVADALESLANGGITTFAGVPTMYFYLLKTPAEQEIRFPSLRTCISGGAAMPVDVMRQFEERFGVPIYEGYGLTETTVSCCCNRPGRDRKAGSIGLPYNKAVMKIVDDAGNELPAGEIGEIVIAGPNVMAGYLNKPEATAEAIRDGWFYSGDLGYRDDEGYYFIVDRKKDMIIKGGYNIYPREIEEVLYQIPQIAEAAVVGAFDEAKGEIVRAVVAFKPGMKVDEKDIRAHLEANLAKYKLPNDYVFMTELPKGPTGKILKREIAKDWRKWNDGRAADPAGAVNS